MKIKPFTHQAEAFNVVAKKRQSLYMIAGTASGKTLAMGLPLFHLLKTGQISKVLFMYPTLALLDDQRRVMEKLARLTNMQVGEIKGGMSRSEITSALNKQVILATPDAIYWFFRKNVKYSHLFIYGLAQVDAFVIDEAHLFNGLVLRNLTHLKNRIQNLARQFGHDPHWHVLTATPHDRLHALTTNGIRVDGKSKCGAVGLELLSPQEKIFEGREKMAEKVDHYLTTGAKKILLVYNSAAATHRLFNKETRKPIDLPLHILQKHGQVKWGKLYDEMMRFGFAEETRAEIAKIVYENATVVCEQISQRVIDKQRSADLMERVSTLLQQQTETILPLCANVDTTAPRWKRDLRKAVGEKCTKLGQLLWHDFAQMIGEKDLQTSLVQWLHDSLSGLEDIWDDMWIQMTLPNLPEVEDALEMVGFSTNLSQAITKQVAATSPVSSNILLQAGQTVKKLRGRALPLDWITNSITDPDDKEYWLDLLQDVASLTELGVQIPAIKAWKESDVPVVIYSGKMAKAERKGLIAAFDALDRAILISTSAVEVGVDFDADVLITEQCAGPDLLQRFGRIGRRANTQGIVSLQLHDHAAFETLQSQLTAQLDREQFSALITTIFPPRQYLSASRLQDASHWLINAQIGRVGEALNADFDPTVAQLAQQVRVAQLNFPFGLRSSLPQITLRNGASVEPFYGLSIIPNEKLNLAQSPFEAAQAAMYYNEFIYQKVEWDILIDWSRTVAASRAIFFQHDNQWRITTGNGIVDDYLQSLSPQASLAMQIWESGAIEKTQLMAQFPIFKRLMRLDPALLEKGSANWLLGYGDVYLQRQHREGGSLPVSDRFETPLTLPDQTWLLILGDKTNILRQLEDADMLEREEIIVSDKGNHIVVLEKVVGACFQFVEEVYHNVA